jgi:anti-sigma factor RsiW
MSTDDSSRGPDPRDLIGAYALDAVDDVERRAVERLVASDPQAAHELAELRATAALLGSAAAAAPPPELRAGVLDAIRRVPQAATVPVADIRPSGVSPTPAAPTPSGGATPAVTDLASRRPRRTATWLAIAATAVGAAAIPSALAIQQAQQNQRAEQQAQAVADLLADPAAQVVRADVEGGGTAVGVLAGDRALFTATGLEDPGAGREYQLWVIRDGEAVPDAVMRDDAGAVQAVTAAYEEGDALAVTVEPASGSTTPTSDPVVVLAPTAS